MKLFKTVYAIQWKHKTNKNSFHIPTRRNFVFKNESAAQSCANMANFQWDMIEHIVVSREVFTLRPIIDSIANTVKSVYRQLFLTVIFA